jgi:hypothetical protein
MEVFTIPSRFFPLLCGQTGMYYLRTKPAVNAIQYTVEKEDVASEIQVVDESDVCTSCQA